MYLYHNHIQTQSYNTFTHRPKLFSSRDVGRMTLNRHRGGFQCDVLGDDRDLRMERIP